MTRKTMNRDIGITAGQPEEAKPDWSNPRVFTFFIIPHTGPSGYWRLTSWDDHEMFRNRSGKSSVWFWMFPVWSWMFPFNLFLAILFYAFYTCIWNLIVLSYLF